MPDHISDLYVPIEGALVRRERIPAPHLSIDAHLTLPWLEVNVRSFSLDEPLDAVFKPSLDYLDLSLRRRSRDDQGAFLGERPMPLAPLGDSVFVPAGQALRVHSRPTSRRVVCCMFDAERLEPLRDWSWGMAELAACRDIRHAQLRQIMLLLAQETLSPGFAAAAQAELLMMSALTYLARHFKGVAQPAQRPGSQLAPWQLRLVRERIESAHGPSPGIVALAAECGLSPRHLARTFKNTTGTTLGAFIADARIRQAKMLLMHPEAMIKTVAHACGFQSAAAFTAAFRRATGRNPREYRSDTTGLHLSPLPSLPS